VSDDVPERYQTALRALQPKRPGFRNARSNAVAGEGPAFGGNDEPVTKSIAKGRKGKLKLKLDRTSSGRSRRRSACARP
jgi:hypothetical protein